MITKNDTILLLGELDDAGIDTTDMLELALRSADVNIAVVKFINSHRPFEANKFYEKIRKSYNSKRSTLYINIMREDMKSPIDMLTTLASLQLQLLLFSKEVQDVQMFLKHTRFEEICSALHTYSKTFDLVPCIKVLQLVKADIKAFQYFSKGE